MDFILFSIILGVASLLQGLTGFGYAVIAGPLVLTFIAKEQMVASMAVISIFLNVYLAIKNKGEAKSRLLVPLLTGAILSLPIGVYLLNHLSVQVMKIGVGIISIVFMAVLSFGHLHFPKFKAFSFIIGSMSGILQTSVSMSGPPVALYLLEQKLKKEDMKEIMAWFFAILSMMTLGSLYMGGLLTLQRSTLGLTALPMVMLGGAIGHKWSEKVNAKLFRKLVMVVVLISGIYSILSAL